MKRLMTLLVGITSLALSPMTAVARGGGGGGGGGGYGGGFGGAGFHGGGGFQGTIPIHTTDTIPMATILTIIIRMAMAIILTAMGTAAFATLIFTGVAFMAVVFTAMAFTAVSLTADVTDTNNSVEQRLGGPIMIKMA